MSLECLTTLMCILSWQRSQTMSLLNTIYMNIDQSHCSFYIGSLLKTTRLGFHQHPLEFKRHIDQLCVLLHILSDIYLKQKNSSIVMVVSL